MRRLRFALLLPLVFACRPSSSGALDSSPPPPSRALAALTGEGCPAEAGAPAGEGWREVRAVTFSFCLPPAWTSADARRGRAWRGEGAEVRWATGSGRETTRTRERIEVRSGESPDAAVQRMVDESRRELRELDEVIGGRRARLFYNHVNGTYYASASWESPVLHFTGTARSPVGAARAMQVYRTVRFATPASESGLH
jgi:hypothetical protein